MTQNTNLSADHTFSPWRVDGERPEGMEVRPIVELWMEGGTPHLQIHLNEAIPFETAKAMLENMRDRLTLEIERGPEHCPFSPTNRSESMPEGECCGETAKDNAAAVARGTITAQIFGDDQGGYLLAAGKRWRPEQE